MSYLVEGASGKWEVVIGLEVHAQVTSRSKLFSGANASFGGAPNGKVSLVDAAMPGMLPVINQFCVEQAVRTGLGLKAQINLRSVFDRKNYFYADSPAGYQISQYKQPIVGEGTVVLDLADGSRKAVGIERLHLEQDAAKSLHDQHPTLTYVDLNRAGVALMEIVSKPDLSSPEEAGAYLRKLRAILRYLGTCDGNMEEGSMRADVNVSVRKPGGPLGTRCEIKNVNSVRFVMQAIEVEARRQVELIEDGGTVQQQTRLFDAVRGQTREMRSKEEAHDYRYFPDPDLKPLVLDPDWVKRIQASLPELPDAKQARFIADFGLSTYDAGVLVAERETADYFEAVAPADAKLAANWIINMPEDAPRLPADQLKELIALIRSGTLSNRMAKEVFEAVATSSRTVAAIVAERGLKQESDEGAIGKVIDQVLASQAPKVAEFRSGKDKLFGFFVGQVMQATGGKANPAAVNKLLREKLNAGG